MTTASVLITEAQKQQYRDEGYFILDEVMPPHFIMLLREECQRFMDLTDREMAHQDQSVRGITHRSKRYFISNRHRESARLREFLFCDLMAEICKATLGDEAYLFWEQFVVKGAEVGMPFSWHQDSGYVGYDHQPYMSCWCALDDVTEENGTVYILPFSSAGTRTRQEHVVDENTHDKVGYFGEDPGIPVVAPAGSIAVFSSVSFHRSGANTTPRLRRVYLAQYSASPILKQDGSGLWGNAVHFVKEGRQIEPIVLETV